MSDLDKVLDQLVAGDEDKAKETFHSMVVQQSRDEFNKLQPQASTDAPVQEARELDSADKMVLAKLMKELDGYKSMVAGETDRDDKKMYKERLRDLESMIKNVTRGRPIDTALQDELSDMYDAGKRKSKSK